MLSYSCRRRCSERNESSRGICSNYFSLKHPKFLLIRFPSSKIQRNVLQFRRIILTYSLSKMNSAIYSKEFSKVWLQRLQGLSLYFKGRVSKLHLLLLSEFIKKVKRYKVQSSLSRIRNRGL